MYINMKLLVLLAVMVCGCQALTAPTYQLLNPEPLFEDFTREHRKQYSNEHEKWMRYQIFKENLNKINEMNLASKEGGTIFGINRFSDLTLQEFTKMYTGLRPSQYGDDFHCDKVKRDNDIPAADVPKAWDWRDKNAVTRIKDQGSCGSCWAFSTIGNIEAQYAIKHKELVELSEQQLVDCDTKSQGCSDGDMASAIRSLIKEGGAELEQDYPYNAVTQTCKFNSSKIKAKVVDCYSFNLTSQEKLKHLLYTNGPLVIGVQANGLMMYHKGIITDAACNFGELNHAVLLIGYGSENGKDYWIGKNSWTEKWGEKGFFRMERGEGHLSCGVMNDAMVTGVVS